MIKNRFILAKKVAVLILHSSLNLLDLHLYMCKDLHAPVCSK